MQQLSLPFRLALGAMIVAGALWTLVLKPKDAATPATTPVAAPVAPGVAGLTRSSNGAKAAVDKANSAAASREQAANAVDPNTASAPTSPAATAATPATADATAAKPATKTAKPAAPVKAAKPAPGSLESFVAGAGPAKSLVRALADGKVVMMVFKNRSSDSAAVERAARKVAAGAGGRIRLRVTNIGNVGKYAVFTAKTPIGQAPTTLIIGPKKTARVIVGFTTTAEIGQAAHEQGTGTSRIAAHRAAAQRRTRRAARAAAARDRIVCKGHGASCVSYFTKVNRACTKLSLGSYDRGFAASAAGGRFGGAD